MKNNLQFSINRQYIRLEIYSQDELVFVWHYGTQKEILEDIRDFFHDFIISQSELSEWKDIIQDSELPYETEGPLLIPSPYDRKNILLYYTRDQYWTGKSKEKAKDLLGFVLEKSPGGKVSKERILKLITTIHEFFGEPVKVLVEKT
ncbi:MAG: hypothetical protein WC662_00940 [Candidatus Paceibacterota bacterium]|jgi:hypothetical protein